MDLIYKKGILLADVIYFTQRNHDTTALDYDFFRALKYSMPPASGVDIDRLCMLLANQVSLLDLLLFPQMRPENRNVGKEEEELLKSS